MDSNVKELIEAIQAPTPDFVERNGAWLISVIGIFAGCVGAVFTYLLKSRCTEIGCGCVSCKRQVLELAPSQVEVTAVQ
jgi:H+/Cl- antiporter ClcA